MLFSRMDVSYCINSGYDNTGRKHCERILYQQQHEITIKICEHFPLLWRSIFTVKPEPHCQGSDRGGRKWA